ncbi:MAG TPA: DNA N-6-adenine-methyltransferase [Gemmatimonadales bacterium]|nr:DNA N-6-adenine-methyltransferase [Gemmatimonadales bacterium]
MKASNACIRPAKSVVYGTPDWLYRWLDARFAFTYDPCPLNDAKIWDSLAESWAGQRVYCNPPYGREIVRWLAKRFEPDLAVYLLPARTDTEWWHTMVLNQATEIMFFRNRIRFVNMPHPAPFPSVAIVYEGQPRTPTFRSVWLTELEPDRGYRIEGA